MLCYVMLCYVMSRYAAMLSYAMLCHAMSCYVMLVDIMLSCELLCNFMLCYVMPAMLCYDMLHYVMLHHPLFYHSPLHVMLLLECWLYVIFSSSGEGFYWYCWCLRTVWLKGFSSEQIGFSRRVPKSILFKVMVAKCIVNPKHGGPISKRGLCKHCQAKKMREGGRKGGQNFRKSFHIAPSTQSKNRRCAGHKKVMKKHKET